MDKYVSHMGKYVKSLLLSRRQARVTSIERRVMRVFRAGRASV